MTTALVLGGGHTLHDDLARYVGPFDGVVACNEAGIEWPGELDAWVTLHARFFLEKGWRRKRAERGYPEARRHYGHPEAFRGHTPEKPKSGMSADLLPTDYRFGSQKERSGSSGLFAAKVALVDLGFDDVVLCGVPMTPAPHFFDARPWKSAEGFRRAWVALPDETRARMRSMSGWTKVLLGSPRAQAHHPKPDLSHLLSERTTA